MVILLLYKYGNSYAAGGGIHQRGSLVLAFNGNLVKSRLNASAMALAPHQSVQGEVYQ